MGRTLGLLISGLAFGAGLFGLIKPQCFGRLINEVRPTKTNARITAIVLLLLGLAGLFAIVGSGGLGAEFFPV